MVEVSPQEIQYQEANINDDASGGLYGSTISMMVVTATAVIVRLLCKRKLNAKITLDDYCIMFALVRPIDPPGAIERWDRLLIEISFFYMAFAWNLYFVNPISTSPAEDQARLTCVTGAHFGGGKHAIVVPIPQQVHMMQVNQISPTYSFGID